MLKGWTKEAEKEWWGGAERPGSREEGAGANQLGRKARMFPRLQIQPSLEVGEGRYLPSPESVCHKSVLNQ